MVNHAARGRRSENNVRDELGAYGYDVIRSAASKGSADLVAIGDGFAVLVQVKLVQHGESFQMPSPAERQQLLRLARRLGNALPVAACHAQGSGGKPAVTAYRLLTGPGPKDWRGWGPGEPTRLDPGTCPTCHTPEGHHTLSCPDQPQVTVPFTDILSVVDL